MDNQTANNTLQALGGNKFIAMTGAKNFVVGDNSLSFKIGRNKGKVICVVIKYLIGQDLYSINFYNKNYEIIKSYESIYCDQLTELFEDVTGMATSL